MVYMEHGGYNLICREQAYDETKKRDATGGVLCHILNKTTREGTIYGNIEDSGTKKDLW